MGTYADSAVPGRETTEPEPAPKSANFPTCSTCQRRVAAHGISRCAGCESDARGDIQAHHQLEAIRTTL